MPPREGLLQPDLFTFTFGATGTVWEIGTRQALTLELQRQLLARVDQFEATYSRFRPDSLVSRVAEAPQGGRFSFPDDALPLFELYDRLHQVTHGAVDPLIGGDLERLGYDRRYRLTPVSEEFQLEDRPSWTRDVVREDTTLLTRHPLMLDVGAAGKGYLVDLLSALLRKAGHTEFVVDGSGDLRHAGPVDLRVGLEHPFEPGMVIGIIPLRNRALCASAVNRRAWGDGLHHVLDARSGHPTREVAATWATADDALTADGLATALFFTDTETLTEHFSFSGVRMFRDGSAEVSRTFAGEVFEEPARALSPP